MPVETGSNTQVNTIGVDGAERFVKMARGYSGCEVWHQDFLKLELPQEYFDGVFANASLFHVPSQELPRVLRELWETLKGGGVLFSSNPRGSNDEGWNGQRYCCYYDWPRWRELLSAAGRFAVPVPLAETMLAGWLLSQGGIVSPEGAMSLAPVQPKDVGVHAGPGASRSAERHLRAKGLG